ncbi:MAG: SDR family oxidoreductase [Bacteroidota bacterium]|nr:SDR family oxidoreductase [Bacteroidota bacterium]
MTIGPQSTILVTGGAGFIGSHVCDALVERGASVRCMDNFATSRPENIAHLQQKKNFSFLGSDIRSIDDCREAVENVDLVVHLAALGSVPRSIADPIASHATNLTGFLNLLESAREAGVRRFVYASSSSVYGDSKELPKREENTGLPLSPYAITKAGNEEYATLYHRLHGSDTVGLRFFNVFGERQDPEGPYAAAIPKFIQNFLDHASPQVHGDGLQSRDFTYVGNAVQAVIAALECEKNECAGQVFNVAYGARTTLLELIGLLRSELAKVDPAIANIQVEHVAPRAGDVRDSLADITRARDLLGFKPAYTLQQGLEKAVPWYVKNYQ